MHPAPADLPPEWFEFQDKPRPIARHPFTPVAPGTHSHSTAPLTYSITLDGREIPFKLLQNPHPPCPPAPHPAPRPVAILLHGMGVTIGSFHGLAPYLLPTHDLLLIDYNSFSVEAGWPTGGVTLRLLAAGVGAVMNALQLPHAALLGNSLGGGLALLAATMMPHRVTRLVLFNPACYPQPLPRHYRLARVPILGELLMGITAPQRLVDGIAWVGFTSPEKMTPQQRAFYTRNMTPAHNRWRVMDVIRHLPLHDAELTGHLAAIKRIQQPTLILWGLQERLLAPENGRRLARDLPHARLLEFPDLAHMPQDEAPARLGPLVANFLNE